MRNLIKIELRTLIDQIDNYHERFGGNDIRTSFLDGYFESLITYFCGYYHLDEEDIIERYYEIYQRNDFNRDDLAIQLQGQRNVLNSGLIINCWSNFELFITLFCYAVLSKDKISELLELDYRKLKKSFNNYSITPEIDNKLKKYIKNHIAHTPIMYKYGALLKMVDPYPSGRDKKNDLGFLEFFGLLRNCIHSNYIYFEEVDKTFTYNDETYLFRNGKLVSQSPLSESSYFRLTKNLKDIFQVIVENIIHEPEIYDPSVELYKVDFIMSI